MTCIIPRGTDSVLLKLYIQPGASRNKIVGLHGVAGSERLKIQIASPPVEGAANEKLVLFLSKTLGISKSRITIIRGEHAREKDVICQGVNVKQLLERI